MARPRGDRGFVGLDPRLPGHAQSVARPGLPLRADVQPLHGRRTAEVRIVPRVSERDRARVPLSSVESGRVRSTVNHDLTPVLQRLSKIVPEILDRFEADREADQAGRDPLARRFHGGQAR